MNICGKFFYVYLCLSAVFIFFLPPAVYSADLPNKLELIKLLKEGNYRRLEALLVQYQSDYEQDSQNEDVVDLAYIAFESSDPVLEKKLNAWITEMPKSFSARLARGAYYHHLGWLSRGAKYIDKTSSTQISGMQHNFAKATEDILAAVTMNPKLSVGYGYLINMGKAEGTRAVNEKLLAEALMTNPYSFTVRERYMHSLTPKWGGSFEAMQRFSEESKKFSGRNQNMKLLPAYIPYARGDVLERAGDREGAAQKYTEAISLGDYAPFLEARGENYYRMGRYDRALVDLNKALALRPQHRASLDARGRTYYAMKNYDESALNDFNLAIALDPLAPNELVSRAMTYWRLKRYNEAEKDYENALVYGKHSAYIWRSKGRFYYYIRKNYQQAASDYTRAVELEPGNSESWYLLGSAYYYLKDRKAVETFERYLEACKIGADCKDKDMTWAQGFVKCMRRTGPCQGNKKDTTSYYPKLLTPRPFGQQPTA